MMNTHEPASRRISVHLKFSMQTETPGPTNSISVSQSLALDAFVASEEQASGAIATRKEGRKGGRKESQSNPFFRQTRVTRPSERFRCVSLSLCASSAPLCFLSRSRFRPLFVSLWRDRSRSQIFQGELGRHRVCGPQHQRRRAARRGAARRGALLIKYLKQSMKANKKCHVGSEEGGSGERDRERGRTEKGRQNWAVSLVCLPVSADVSGEIRVERGVGSAAISSSRRERETDRPRPPAGSLPSEDIIQVLSLPPSLRPG